LVWGSTTALQRSSNATSYNGLVVRDGDGDVNAGYSWHIDPADVDWADGTTEVCDGLPSDVEKGIISSDRYCPGVRRWSRWTELKIARAGVRAWSVDITGVFLGVRAASGRTQDRRTDVLTACPPNAQAS
jgi:hypothetical protein